ncbi:hypothetical protein HNQ50_003560 [Silvimonas terrae]|uniref:Uncharacterized protein n=1 Tax=Silvimonas terrae TaxID=300266 RepID=A0A840RKH9_9NEIS|nr:hypothetical protein [Silvimonas terrae]
MLIHKKRRTGAVFYGCALDSTKRIAVGVAVGVGVGVVFDFPSPLKPSAEGVEGDLRLPTNRGQPGGPPGWGRLSLVTFFGEAKKVTWARHPGYRTPFNPAPKVLTRCSSFSGPVLQRPPAVADWIPAQGRNDEVVARYTSYSCQYLNPEFPAIRPSSGLRRYNTHCQGHL